LKVHLPALTQGAKKKVEATSNARRFPTGNGELILVADDEVAVRDLIRTILENYGYQVLTAADGVEALKVYSEHRGNIRLVVTDLDMPRMPGPQLIRALETADPSVKVISVTGLIDGNKVGHVVSGSVRAVLQKPFSPLKLLETLHDILKPAVQVKARSSSV
jgi:CheY-like chemotaxis protein